MATADEVYLPEEVERGAVVSYVYSTEIHEGDDGSDDRHPRFSWPKLRAVISYGPEYVQDVEDLFITQQGPRYSFLFRPPLARHYTVVRQQMGDYADGVSNTFQLEKTVSVVGGRSITIPILHPRTATVRVWIDDAELGASDFSVGALGVVTLDVTPPYGAIREASCEEDFAMRFVADELDISLPDSSGEDEIVQEIRRLTIEQAFNE